MRFPYELLAVPEPEWVDTVDGAQRVLAEISGNTNLPVAVDTETTGTKRWKDRVVVWSISNGRRRWTLTGDLLPVFAEFLRTAPDITMHGANFDRAMIRNSGVDMVSGTELGRVRDTMIQHHWLNQDVPHKLEWIMEHELGLYKVSFAETFGTGKNEKPFIDPTQLGDESYRRKVCHYASWDAFGTALLRIRCDLLLRQDGVYDLFHDQETKFTDAVYIMESTGVLIDRARLESYRPIYQQRLEYIQSEFNRLAGRPINLASPKQVREFFYDIRGKKAEKFTKGSIGTDEPLGSTDAEVLETWKNEGDRMAALLLEFRALDKQRGTYVDGILDRLSPNNRLYTEFNLHVAATGRLSSSDPNLQNIIGDGKVSDELRELGVSFREVFIPDEGRIFLDADYDQVEMVLGAYISNDARLLNAVRAGMDLHCSTASRLFGVPYEAIVSAKKKDNRGEELTSEEKQLLKYRKIAKTINFGIFYGMGPGLLSKRTGASIEEARQFINLFFNMYPGVREYTERQRDMLLKYGFVTTILGRRRYISGAHSLDRETASAAIREAVNTPIQGSAKDVMTLPMIRLATDPELVAAGVRIHLQVHDELLFSVPEEEADRVIPRIEEIMAHPFVKDLDVPFTAKCHKGRNWAQAK